MRDRPEYNALAKYYDMYYQDRTEDIEFWKSIVARVGSPILELSCGTGRLTFQIAQAGAIVTGVDISSSMLLRARKKCRNYSPSVQKRVTFLQGDTRSFRLGKQFQAILCPEAFWAVTDEEQASMMASIKSHLVPDGYLVMSVYNFHESSDSVYAHRLKFCKRFPEYKFTLTRESFVERAKDSHVDRIIHILDRVYDDGTVKRIITERYERQRTKSELLTLLWSNGFVVKSVYGDYDFGPWSESSQWTIVVAQLPLRRSPVHHLARLLGW